MREYTGGVYPEHRIGIAIYVRCELCSEIRWSEMTIFNMVSDWLDISKLVADAWGVICLYQVIHGDIQIHNRYISTGFDISMDAVEIPAQTGLAVTLTA